MPKTVNVTTPTDSQIQVTRTFDAPMQSVFDFHTKPELVTQWLTGTPGYSMPVCEIDFKVGGSYRYVWSNPESQIEFGVRGTYREIDAPKRIVHTESMDGMPGESLNTLTLDEVKGRTTLTYLMDFGSREIRDQVLQYGMTDGMALSYDRLDERLSRTVGANAIRPGW